MSLPFNPTRRVLCCVQTASNLTLHQIVWRHFFFKLNIVSIFSLQCHSTFIFFIGIFSILVEFMMTCKPLFKFDIKWLNYMPNIVDSLDTLESSRVCELKSHFYWIYFLKWLAAPSWDVALLFGCAAFPELNLDLEINDSKREYYTKRERERERLMQSSVYRKKCKLTRSISLSRVGTSRVKTCNLTNPMLIHWMLCSSSLEMLFVAVGSPFCFVAFCSIDLVHFVNIFIFLMFPISSCCHECRELFSINRVRISPNELESRNLQLTRKGAVPTLSTWVGGYSSQVWWRKK